MELEGDIFCPYCDEYIDQNDIDLYSLNDQYPDNKSCPHCDKIFEITLNISYFYDIREIEQPEENEEEEIIDHPNQTFFRFYNT